MASSRSAKTRFGTIQKKQITIIHVCCMTAGTIGLDLSNDN
jgi:hypothetical protein